MKVLIIYMQKFLQTLENSKQLEPEYESLCLNHIKRDVTVYRKLL